MLNTTTLSPLCKAFYERLMLEQLVGKFWFLSFADEGRVITLKEGEYSVEFSRFTELTPATTPLTEGVTPPGQDYSATLITAVPSQYGDWTGFTDRVSMTSIDPTITRIVNSQKLQASKSFDIICRDTLVNTSTSRQYANGKSAREQLTATDILTTADIDLGVRTLERNSVPYIDDEFGGSYVLMIHPDQKLDIRKDENWKKPDQYGAGVKHYNGEVGRWNRCRIIVNSNAKKFAGAGASGVDVFASPMFGAHWFGTVKWVDDTGGVKVEVDGGQMIEIFVHQLGSAGAADPLNQRGSVGWKASLVVKILNQLCGIILETGATA